MPPCVWQNEPMPLLSEKQVVRQVASLMQAHGVSRCVLCSGSRNAPLSATLSSLFECRMVTDERSAGFTALGWAAQAKAPVAVCVTSGSALLNLHPAVAEAYYRRIPILILTADRPTAWIGQQDGQTLPQQGVFGSMVSAAFQTAEEDAWYSNRQINEALLTLASQRRPVHLNIPLSEPFFAMSEGTLPRERVIRRGGEEETLRQLLQQCPRRLLLVGQTLEEALPLRAFQEAGFVIIGDCLAETEGLCVLPPDAAFASGRVGEEAVPDVLLTVGGCIVSKALKNFFRQHRPKEHWHISRGAEVVDTFCCLTRVLEPAAAAALPALCPNGGQAAADFAAQWHSLLQARPLSTAAYNAVSLVGRTLEALPAEAKLHLANSSAVRYANLFPMRGQAAECNRGVNGIEGSLSAAVGYAMGDAHLNLLIIGDLSFFYDMNALWQPLPPRLRILLLNNGGGAIFKGLRGIPQADAVSAPHDGTAAAWAASRGLRTFTVHSWQDWEPALAALTDETGDTPVLVEAFTDGAADAAAYQAALMG